jgi:dynactin complex subunit
VAIQTLLLMLKELKENIVVVEEKHSDQKEDSEGLKSGNLFKLNGKPF